MKWRTLETKRAVKCRVLEGGSGAPLVYFHGAGGLLKDNPFLDQLTTEKLLVDLPLNGKKSGQTQGSAIRRLTYHYWYHIGEIQAIRQQLGEKSLPIYVGNIEGKAPYRPERD